MEIPLEILDGNPGHPSLADDLTTHSRDELNAHGKCRAWHLKRSGTIGHKPRVSRAVQALSFSSGKNGMRGNADAT